MIVIGIAGFIRTEWIAMDRGEILHHIFTKGIVPFVQTRREISRIVRLELPSFFFENKIKQVFFYGIACAQPDNKKIIESALIAHFKAPIYVDHLLLAASRSLYQDEAGITSIVDSSTLTCLYDGEYIVKYLFNGGYILGDEGSSSELAKLFISDLVKGFVPQNLSDIYMTNFDTNFNNLMETFYSGFAIQSLNTTVQFLYEHSDDPYVLNLIKTNFTLYVERNLCKFDDIYNKKIKIIGSFAYRFRDVLIEVLKEKGITVDSIVESAMDGLIEYHKNHPIY